MVIKRDALCAEVDRVVRETLAKLADRCDDEGELARAILSVSCGLIKDIAQNEPVKNRHHWAGQLYQLADKLAKP